MPEDPLNLREELAQLKKDIFSSRHIKEVLDQRIKELSEEEMRYLNEIPSYKHQAKNEAVKAGDTVRLTEATRSELNKVNLELSSIQLEVAKQSEIIRNRVNVAREIEKKCEDREYSVDYREHQCANRELTVQLREKQCDEKELALIARDEAVFKDEFAASKNKREVQEANERLNDNLKSYSNNLEVHARNLAVLDQRKKFMSEDEQILKIKLEKAERLVRESVEIKAQELLQADKLSKELLACKHKQDSLDRNIADLKNQENVLKIKELKIKKLAHEAGLEKELRDLEASMA